MPDLATDIEAARDVAKANLEEIHHSHRAVGVTGYIGFEGATVPYGYYIWDTSMDHYNSLPRTKEHLANSAAGTEVPVKTKDKIYLSMDLDTFNFMYLHIWQHHHWSNTAEGNVAGQIDAAVDIPAVNIQARYDQAYEDAKAA